MGMQAFFVLTLSGAAAFLDICTGRIGNLLCAAGLSAGLFLAGCGVAAGGSPLPAVMFLAGAAIPFACGFPLFRFRMIGAGDVKLLMAIGGLIGVPAILHFLVAAVASGAVIAAGVLLFITGVRPRLARLLRYIRATEITGEIQPYRDSRIAEFHFSVPVLMAAILYAAGMLQTGA